MSDDVWDDEWEQYIRDELVPRIADSTATLSLVPQGETDIKFAVELGLSIMMDKPLILVVLPGRTVPQRLRRAADAVIEGEIQHPKTAARISAALDQIMSKEH